MALMKKILYEIDFISNVYNSVTEMLQNLLKQAEHMENAALVNGCDHQILRGRIFWGYNLWEDWSNALKCLLYFLF